MDHAYKFGKRVREGRSGKAMKVGWRSFALAPFQVSIWRNYAFLHCPFTPTVFIGGFMAVFSPFNLISS